MNALHRRTKQLDYWDVAMNGLAGLSLGFVLARIVPELIDVNPWWWATLILLMTLRPLYHFWISPSAR